MAKVNALTDSDMITALYRASTAGVPVDLIVRGPCCLRPGVAGLSENIRVVSVVGRFLEHTRAYYFCNDQDEKVYLSSADLMMRNLSQRVEVAFLIENEKLRKRIVKEAFHCYLEDNACAWQLNADGTYQKKTVATDAEQISAQTVLLNRLTVAK
jgi:polyphosphate kinase